MSGQFYTGSSSDGRDLRPALGMFVDNEDDPKEWSSAPFNDAQRKYVKEYKFHWDLMKKCNYDIDSIYKKIKNNTLRFFTKAEKEYIVELIENEDHE